MKFLLITALFVAAPLTAQETGLQAAPYDAASKSDEELIAKTGDESDPWLQRPCELGLPLFTELLRRAPEQEFYSRGQLLAGAVCDDEVGDYTGGYNKVKQLEAGWPNLNFRDLGRYFARRTEDAQGYLSRLRALDGEAIESIRAQSFWDGIRMLRRQGAEQQAEDLMLVWVEQGQMAYLSAEMQTGVARLALKSALRQGRSDMAPQLLGTIRAPDSYIDFLADREFEAIWPLLEERAGPNLERIADDYIFWAMGRLENHPRDRDRFSTAAHALHYAGRFEEAIKLAQAWRKRDGAIASIEEGDGWALNIEAYAHDALGETGEADAVFNQLAELDPEQHPWVVNFVINRASRLVGQERWEEGLAASALARDVAQKWGSDYARLIIARDHACALTALGRAEDVGEELAFIRSHKSESYQIAAQALMCTGQRMEAVALLLEGIKDGRYRANSLAALMSPKFDLFYTPSRLPQPAELLDESPELQTAFSQYARRIPDAFIPAASIRAKR